jgi:hypothetical protein
MEGRALTSIPQAGDVVIHKTDQTPANTPYGVGIYEGLVQFVAASLRIARAEADSFARAHALDVWYTDETGDARHYTRISRFRFPGTTPRPAQHASVPAR